MYFLKANTQHGIILGIWTCLNRVCVGRSGELAIQSYDCMTWNDAEGGILSSLAALSKPFKKLNTALKKLIRPTAPELVQVGAIYVDGLDPATTATSI